MSTDEMPPRIVLLHRSHHDTLALRKNVKGRYDSFNIIAIVLLLRYLGNVHGNDGELSSGSNSTRQ
jgi:hypothetical protein